MTEEENKAIENIEKRLIIEKYTKNIGTPVYIKDIETILNLMQKLQKENEKLKSKNQDLLKKLRNRVKEVKKLNKYSLYKIEFANLNKQIREKDKIIDLMAKSWKQDDTRTVEKIKQYFKKQTKEV